jgi:tRNA A-37 threonylcarbamoyl transferase component Bud32
MPAAALGEEIAGFAWEASRFFPRLTLAGLLEGSVHLRPVKTGRRRVFELKGPGTAFYLKLASVPPARSPLRFLRRFAEWRNLHRLAARGVAACRPAMRGWGGAGRRGAFFLVTEAVAGSPLDAARLPVEPLGRFAAGLNAAGAFAADLHPQNLLVRPDGSLCLIDAQALFFLPGVARRLGAWQIGRLLAGFPEGAVPPPALDALVAAYNRSAPGPPVTAAAAERAARFFRRRRLRSRSRRACVESSAFTVVRGPEGRGFRRRDFSLGPRELAAAFEAGEPLKEGHVRRSGGICIKSSARRRFHRDRCLAGWRMSHALAVRAVPVARALACYRAGGRSYLATEYLEGSTPLNAYLSALSGFALRQALRDLAAFLRGLHAAGVWQHDLKSANILVRGGRFFLVDLDGVRLGRLSPRRVRMNLAQLNASVSGAVGLKARLRFYRYYHGERLPPRAARRADYRAVWELSARRNTGASGLELERLLPRPPRPAAAGRPPARSPARIERVVFVGKSKRRTGNTRHMLAALRRRVPQVLYLNPARIRRFGFRRDVGRTIAARIEKFRPDLVLSYSKDLPYPVLAGLRGKVTTAVFYPDVRIPLDEQLVRHGRLADYLFITNTRQIPELAARGVRRPLFTLQGCDRDEHRIVPARRRKWAAEAAFIGRPSDAFRIELLREVGRRFQLKTWGGPWRRLGFDCPQESVYARDYARICHATPVILGCDFSREMDHNTSNRTWITLGCGGFLLTNYQAGLETIFTRGVHLEWYHSVEECLELIAYYLGHESERRRIARQGYEFAHAEHTYDHVMDALIRRIEAAACESCT